MNRIILIDATLSSEVSSKIGLYKKHSSSSIWSKNINFQNDFDAILRNVKIISERDSEYIYISIDLTNDYETIFSCYFDYFNILYTKVNQYLDKDFGNEVIFCLNYTPFIISATQVDKLIVAMQEAFVRFVHEIILKFLFFTNNAVSFSHSNMLNKLLLKYHNLMILILDDDGYIQILSYQTSEKRICKTNYALPTDLSSQIVTFKSFQAIYRTLIYETRKNIGHFLLNNAHIRTYYDLDDFVKNA
jgi:hypothetical protein